MQKPARETLNPENLFELAAMYGYKFEVIQLEMLHM